MSCLLAIFLMQKTECFECGKSGHVARNCPNKYSKPRSSTGLCLLCGRLGHDVSSCSGEYDPDDMKVFLIRCYSHIFWTLSSCSNLRLSSVVVLLDLYLFSGW